MIYIVFEIYYDLVPRLTAFSSKKEMHLYLRRCQIKKQSADDYSFGELKIPYSRNKKKLMDNITWATEGGAVDHE